MGKQIVQGCGVCVWGGGQGSYQCLQDCLMPGAAAGCCWQQLCWALPEPSFPNEDAWTQCPAWLLQRETQMCACMCAGLFGGQPGILW